MHKTKEKNVDKNKYAVKDKKNKTILLEKNLLFSIKNKMFRYV